VSLVCFAQWLALFLFPLIYFYIHFFRYSSWYCIYPPVLLLSFHFFFSFLSWLLGYIGLGELSPGGLFVFFLSSSTSFLFFLFGPCWSYSFSPSPLPFSPQSSPCPGPSWAFFPLLSLFYFGLGHKYWPWYTGTGREICSRGFSQCFYIVVFDFCILN